MPVKAKSFDNHVLDDWLPAALALTAEAIRMTSDAPCIALFLYERHSLIEWIATLRAEEMSWVPVRAACDNAFAFDGRLAGFAAWTEKLVEVEMAIEAG
jgi:hypothetical protein